MSNANFKLTLTLACIAPVPVSKALSIHSPDSESCKQCVDKVVHVALQCMKNPVPIGVGYLAQYIIKPLLGFAIAKVGSVLSQPRHLEPAPRSEPLSLCMCQCIVESRCLPCT